MKRWSVVQGGMGIGVSLHRLAQAVSDYPGQQALGTVSLAGIDRVVPYILQMGDPTGNYRRAFEAFPIPEIAQRVWEKYFHKEGKAPDEPFMRLPQWNLERKTMEFRKDLLDLTVVSAFAEIWLAREKGNCIACNFLYKAQLPLLAILLGALIANVDIVVMGAGIPTEIPRILNSLASVKPTEFRIFAHHSSQQKSFDVNFDPRPYVPAGKELIRPEFGAIVTLDPIVRRLCASDTTRPDFFIVEHHRAGGHNAPPRDTDYGLRDEPDNRKIIECCKKYNLPVWRAGGCSNPEALKEAQCCGYTGVQVGTAFALADESGIDEEYKGTLRRDIIDGNIDIVTDGRVSSSGFPFKIAQGPGIVPESWVQENRVRRCEHSLLASLTKRSDGKIVLICEGGPIDAYKKNGGEEVNTVGRSCLCSRLLRTAGFKIPGEFPIITFGDDLSAIKYLAEKHRPDLNYSAKDVIEYILGKNI